MGIIGKLEAMRDFTESEQVVASYIMEHKDNVIDLNIDSLAKCTYTSNATIIRLCRKIGTSGYKEFKIQFVKEIEKWRNENKLVDTNYPFTLKDSTENIMKNIAELSKEAINVCYSSVSSDSLILAVKLIVAAEHVYIYAGGDSLISAISFSNRLLKLGKHTVIANQYNEERATTFGSTQRDVALFVSYSGRGVARYKESIRILKHNKCKIIFITSAENVEGFDLTVHFPGKEIKGSKIANFYSQMEIGYILNCIYALIFATDYENNRNKKNLAEGYQ